MMTPIDKDAVLNAFAAEPIHDRNTLEHYVSGYPDLAKELIDLAIEFRLSDDIGGTDKDVISDPKLKIAWENFLASGTKPAAETAVVDVFVPFKGAAFAMLAGKLDIPRSILTAIRDRLVVSSSVPDGLIHRFAEATGNKVETVKAYLAQDSQAPLGLAFKSDQKPSRQGQATFRQLVESTEMNASQRLLLLRECEEHELT